MREIEKFKKAVKPIISVASLQKSNSKTRAVLASRNEDVVIGSPTEEELTDSRERMPLKVDLSFANIPKDKIHV